MKQVILFDIDGTLADINHRRVHLNSDRPDWKLFNSSMGNDVPNKPVVELYKTLWASKKYELLLVSGRSEDSRKITEQWLTWNEIPFNVIFMRAAGDFRSDVDVKYDILQTIRTTYGEVLFAVDDRQQVVDMWRKNGITCFQCAEGNF